MTLSRMKLSADGPEFSRIAQGFWRMADWKMTVPERAKLIDACLDLGITTFDHADLYGDYTCEQLFAEAFAEMSVPRDRVQIVTKCGIKLLSPNRPDHRVKHYDTSAAHILKSVDNSLANLRTDYLDLLLIHRPDPLLRADEVASAFARLKKSGKVRHFGVSNFIPSQFELLQAKMDFPLVTNQVEYSALNMTAQDDGTLDLCQRLNISPMAWSPLAGGRIFTESGERAIRVRSAMEKVCAELGGAAIDQVALAFVKRHPADFNIVLGTGKIDRIKSAVAADSLELSREQWFTIWEASKGHSVA